MNLILIKSTRLKDLTGKVSKSQKGLQNPWWLCVCKTSFNFSETKLVIWRKLILRNPEKSGFGNDLPHLTQLRVEEAPTHLVTGSVSRTAGPPIDQWMPAYCWTIAQGFALSQLGQGLLTHPWEHLSGTEPAWLFAVWESLAECSIYHNFSFVVPSAYVLLLENEGIIAINLKKGIFTFLVFPSFPKYLRIYSATLPPPRNFALLKAICSLNSNSICEGIWSPGSSMERHQLVPWINCRFSLSGLGALLGPLWTDCFVNCHDWKHEQIQWIKNL